MKRCPNCNDFALYDDEIMNCPICDSRLMTYVRGGEFIDDAVVRPETEHNHNQQANTIPPFETVNGNTYIFRGMVTEISTQQRWNNRLKKILNSIFRSEPYQFGNTSQECVLRIEEFRNGRMASQRRDVIFYGEAEGRVTHGDDVTVTAKRKNGRFIVSRLQVNDTGANVRPSVQIPAGIIKFFAAFVALIVLYLVVGFISLVATGSFASFLSGVMGWIFNMAFKVFGAFAPFIILFVVFRAMFRR